MKKFIKALLVMTLLCGFGFGFQTKTEASVLKQKITIPVIKKGIYFNKTSFTPGETAKFTINSRPNEILMLTVIGPKGEVLVAGEIRTNKYGVYKVNQKVYGPYGKYSFYTLDERDRTMIGSFNLVKKAYQKVSK